MKLSEQYAAAMRAGNHGLCFAIERRQGLDGFPPELVCVGLLALEAGRDPYAAIGEQFDAAVDADRDPIPSHGIGSDVPVQGSSNG